MREEAKKAEEEAARAAGVSVAVSDSEAKARAGRNAQLGGMGLLYALGADEYLFQRVCNPSYFTCFAQGLVAHASFTERCFKEDRRRGTIERHGM